MGQAAKIKSVELILDEAGKRGDSALPRVLKAKDLVMLGIGAIIGAGIFATTGTAAAGTDGRPGAGPAIVLSFIMVAVTCGFRGVRLHDPDRR